MSLRRALSALIPSGAVREFLRVGTYNWKFRGRARFSRAGERYVTQFPSGKFETLQAAYGIRELLDVYERRHKILPGDVILDVGAHHGSVLLALAVLTGPNGLVIGLEPDDQNRQVLLQNLAFNTNLGNIRLVSDALWDRITTIDFFERGSLGSSALWDGPSSEKKTKQTVTLDVLAERFELMRLDLVIMNAEGAELKAFAGGERVLRELRPEFAIASNHFVDGKYTYETVERELRSRGYDAETVWHNKEECVTFGTPQRPHLERSMSATRCMSSAE